MAQDLVDKRIVHLSNLLVDLPKGKIRAAMLGSNGGTGLFDIYKRDADDSSGSIALLFFAKEEDAERCLLVSCF